MNWPSVGDGPCGRCGGNNPAVWFVSPNERWNEVMGDGSGLLCPNCYFALVQERGFDDGTRCWAIIREDEQALAWQERWDHGHSVGVDSLQPGLTALVEKWRADSAFRAGVTRRDGYCVMLERHADEARRLLADGTGSGEPEGP